MAFLSGGVDHVIVHITRSLTIGPRSVASIVIEGNAASERKDGATVPHVM